MCTSYISNHNIRISVLQWKICALFEQRTIYEYIIRNDFVRNHCVYFLFGFKFFGWNWIITHDELKKKNHIELNKCVLCYAGNCVSINGYLSLHLQLHESIKWGFHSSLSLSLFQLFNSLLYKILEKHIASSLTHLIRDKSEAETEIERECICVSSDCRLHFINCNFDWGWWIGINQNMLT